MAQDTRVPIIFGAILLPLLAVAISTGSSALIGVLVVLMLAGLFAAGQSHGRAQHGRS